jgi:hypothetical protein
LNLTPRLGKRAIYGWALLNPFTRLLRVRTIGHCRAVYNRERDCKQGKSQWKNHKVKKQSIYLFL